MLTNGMTNQLGYARIVTWIQSITDALFMKTADDSAESAAHQEFATARAMQLFGQALRENSDMELDWLWYAASMPGGDQRRYCLHRALAINPDSSLARSALERLPKPAESTCRIADALTP